MTKKLVVSASLLAKSQVASYTRSDGTVVQAHDTGRQAAAQKPAASGRAAPKPGEVGHDEHSQYGVYFRKGDKVKDGSGKVHEVMSHRGAQVQTYSGGSFHPTKLSHADAPSTGARKVGVRASVAKPAAAKTGSAAPAKTVNVGTDKWPLHAKSSDALGAKHPDGSTHHIGGFEPPAHGKGDHLIHHDGKTFSYSGKSGKNMKTGEASYEYSAGDTGEHRAWVTRSGHLMND